MAKRHAELENNANAIAKGDSELESRANVIAKGDDELKSRANAIAKGDGELESRANVMAKAMTNSEVRRRMTRELIASGRCVLNLSGGEHNTDGKLKWWPRNGLRAADVCSISAGESTTPTAN